MRGLTITTLLAVAFPHVAAAQANCPTAWDAAGDGIYFTVDGREDLHRLRPNNVVTIETEADNTGFFSRTAAAYGLHVLELADFQDGEQLEESVWRFIFPMPVAELPEPVAGETWEVQTRTLVDLEQGRETVKHVWGDEIMHDLGACSYRAIPVTVAYTSDTAFHTEEVLYFPELRTSILTAYRQDGQETLYETTNVRAK